MANKMNVALLVMAILLLERALNGGGCFQGQNEINSSILEGRRVEALVYNIAANSPPGAEPEYVAEEQLNFFNKKDIPILADFVVDDLREVDFRRRALGIIAKLGPDDRTLERLGTFIKDNVIQHQRVRASGIEMVSPVRRFLFNLYRETHNEKILEPYRWLLQQTACDLICRYDAMMFLRETGSSENIVLFKQILEDPNRTEGEKAGAAYGMAKAGDESSIDYLISMANYLFDTSILKGHPADLLMALEGLALLARKNPKANKVIQDLAARCSQDMNANYIYRDTMFTEPIAALASVGGEANARFLENTIIPNCRDQRIVNGAIEALGKIGDRQSIVYLEGLRNLLPERVEESVRQIQRRLRKK